MKPTYEELERERNELAAQVERLTVMPYTKTRAEFMESLGVDGMSADKKRLINAAWDRAEWFFNQRAALLKAQWQAEAIDSAINELSYCGCDGQAWASELEQYAIKLRAQEAGDA